jgi:hypothetical protein
MLEFTFRLDESMFCRLYSDLTVALLQGLNKGKITSFDFYRITDISELTDELYVMSFIRGEILHHTAISFFIDQCLRWNHLKIDKLGYLYVPGILNYDNTAKIIGEKFHNHYLCESDLKISNVAFKLKKGTHKISKKSGLTFKSLCFLRDITLHGKCGYSCMFIEFSKLDPRMFKHSPLGYVKRDILSFKADTMNNGLLSIWDIDSGVNRFEQRLKIKYRGLSTVFNDPDLEELTAQIEFTEKGEKLINKMKKIGLFSMYLATH